MAKVILSKETDSALCENFNQLYPVLNRYVMEEGSREDSRNGPVAEIIGFKTIIENPIQRCIGGSGRNMNVFFLIAEALWIWCGRKDVAFLDIFNSKLKNYSDDGETYHAPYGYRLRQYNLRSKVEEGDEFSIGIDQIEVCLNMLKRNKDDRRVVMSIWNPNLDLDKQGRDLPCNDLLFFKIREGKLNLTVNNRSNDLNLGLTTNVFQFSFILEMMAQILDVPVGSQRHNSDSLHIYTEEQQSSDYYNNVRFTQACPHGTGDQNLYDFSHCLPLGINFDGEETVSGRLSKLDFFCRSILTIINKLHAEGSIAPEEEAFIEQQLTEFSPGLYTMCHLMMVFVKYKQKQFDRQQAMMAIIESGLDLNCDIVVLALNFFATGMMKRNEEMYVEEYIKFNNLNPLIGKL